MYGSEKVKMYSNVKLKLDRDCKSRQHYDRNAALGSGGRGP